MRFKNGKGSDRTYSEFSVLNLVSGDELVQGQRHVPDGLSLIPQGGKRKLISRIVLTSTWDG